MMKTLRHLAAGLAMTLGAVAATAGPEIQWLTPIHNFGAFDEDEGIVSCEFRFVNVGDEPLVVLSARASCGCTRPAFSKEPVAPGDTAAITVAYDPAGRPGRFNKSIHVDTNAPARTSKLTIEGVVIGAKASVAARYPVDKGSLKLRNAAVMFGQVTKPHMKTVFAEAYNRSADSLAMKVVSKPRYVDINFEPTVVPPGEQVSVICYLRSAETGLWGLVDDSITVAAGREEITIPLTAIVNEDFSKLSPDDLRKAPVARLEDQRVDFGTIERGSTEPLAGTMMLSNGGSNRLEIRRVYSVDPGVSATVDRTSVKKGQSTTISVSVDPTQLRSDLLNARVSIITNDPANPVQTLRVVGQVK